MRPRTSLRAGAHFYSSKAKRQPPFTARRGATIRPRFALTSGFHAASAITRARELVLAQIAMGTRRRKRARSRDRVSARSRDRVSARTRDREIARSRKCTQARGTWANPAPRGVAKRWQALLLSSSRIWRLIGVQCGAARPRSLCTRRICAPVRGARSLLKLRVGRGCRALSQCLGLSRGGGAQQPTAPGG